MGTGAQTGAWLDVSTDFVKTDWAEGSVGRGLGEAQTPTWPGTRRRESPDGAGNSPGREGQHRGEGSWEPGRGETGGSTEGGRGCPRKDRWDGSARGRGLSQREDTGSGWDPGDAGRWRGRRGWALRESPSLPSSAHPQGSPLPAGARSAHPTGGRRRGGGCARRRRRRESGLGCSRRPALALRRARRQRRSGAASPRPSPRRPARSPRRGRAAGTRSGGTASHRRDGERTRAASAGSGPAAEESPVGERASSRGCGKPGPGWGPGGGRRGAPAAGPPGRRGARARGLRRLVLQSVTVRLLLATGECARLGSQSCSGPGRGAGAMRASSEPPRAAGSFFRDCVGACGAVCVRVTVRACLPGGLSGRTGCAGVWRAGR